MDLNSSDNSTTGTQATNLENYIVAAGIFVFAFITLGLYTLIIIVIFKNINGFAKHSYYYIALSLAFCDCTALCLNFFYSVPCTILQKHIFGEGFDIAMGTICNIAYFAGLGCISSLAINRYWAVCRFFNYVNIWSDRNVAALLVLCWSFGLASGLFQALPCCYLHYYYDTYTYGYDKNLWGNKYYIWFDRGATTATFVVIIVSYTLIILKKPSRVVANQQRSNAEKQANLERRLASQSGFDATFQILFGLGFTVIPKLTQNKWCLLMVNMLYIINSGNNPFIYLYFNEQIRHGFMELVGLKKKEIRATDPSAAKHVAAARAVARAESAKPSEIAS